MIFLAAFGNFAPYALSNARIAAWAWSLSSAPQISASRAALDSPDWRLHLDRPGAGDDLARPAVAVTHHQAPTVLATLIGQVGQIPRPPAP